MPVLRFLSTLQKVCRATSPLLGISSVMSVTPKVLRACESGARRYMRKVRWVVGPPELRLAERLYGVVSITCHPGFTGSLPSYRTLQGTGQHFQYADSKRTKYTLTHPLLSNDGAVLFNQQNRFVILKNMYIIL